MSDKLVAKLKGFHGGRRYRVGDEIITLKEGEKPAAWMVPANTVVEEKPDNPAEDTTTPVGAGIPSKADSGSDVPIDGQGEAPKASEAAVKLMEELNINIEDVTGTGTGGQITKPDVDKFVKDNTGEI